MTQRAVGGDDELVWRHRLVLGERDKLVCKAVDRLFDEQGHGGSMRLGDALAVLSEGSAGDGEDGGVFGKSCLGAFSRFLFGDTNSDGEESDRVQQECEQECSGAASGDLEAALPALCRHTYMHSVADCPCCQCWKPVVGSVKGEKNAVTQVETLAVDRKGQGERSTEEWDQDAWLKQTPDVEIRLSD